MEWIVVALFALGYTVIVFEHAIRLNKAASALLTGVLCWAVYILMSDDATGVPGELSHHLGGIAEILFFLMGAMTIVELIDAHDGFEVITARITTTDKRKLLWAVSIIAFFLSAVLDNLTTAIVMVSLCRKLIADKHDRMFFVGMIVIAANAGGAWSPVGDVTTTMLWIGGQVTSMNIILKLIVPSLICLVVPLFAASFFIKGKVERPENTVSALKTISSSPFERGLVFFCGLGALIFVPVFKSITHLPPYMGILFGLGLLWVITEFIHHEKDDEDKDLLSVVHALRKIDVPSILFFLGILLAISALESTGTLGRLAQGMNEKIGNESGIGLLMGLLSAVVDNVPLVAAAQGMYPLETYPTDSYLWVLIAFCSGTGGSILIIGSAAGVAVMGMEKISFFWYLKKTGWLAALGFFAGALAYIVFELAAS